MTSLNNVYRIKSYNPNRNVGLNDLFGVHKHVDVVNNQSTLFKDAESISFNNRLEIQKVKEFAQLEKNWDSYDAQEISHKVISQSIALIEEIDRFEEDVYFTSPGPNGEIMIQLKKDAKEVEFIVYSNKSKYVIFNNNEFVKQGQFSVQILPEIIEWNTSSQSGIY